MNLALKLEDFRVNRDTFLPIFIEASGNLGYGNIKVEVTV